MSQARDPFAHRGPSFAGKTVVVTGTFSGLKRKDVEAMLTAAGATLGSGVTKKTNLLIVGTDAGSKLAKAQELGVEIMDEAAFSALVGGGGGGGGGGGEFAELEARLRANPDDTATLLFMAKLFPDFDPRSMSPRRKQKEIEV